MNLNVELLMPLRLLLHSSPHPIILSGSSSSPLLLLPGGSLSLQTSTWASKLPFLLPPTSSSFSPHFQSFFRLSFSLFLFFLFYLFLLSNPLPPFLLFLFLFYSWWVPLHSLPLLLRPSFFLLLSNVCTFIWLWQTKQKKDMKPLDDPWGGSDPVCCPDSPLVWILLSVTELDWTSMNWTLHLYIKSSTDSTGLLWTDLYCSAPHWSFPLLKRVLLFCTRPVCGATWDQSSSDQSSSDQFLRSLVQFLSPPSTLDPVRGVVCLSFSPRTWCLGPCGPGRLTEWFY